MFWTNRDHRLSWILRTNRRACELDVDDALASVFQHEYDHLEGILYIDYLTSITSALFAAAS